MKAKTNCHCIHDCMKIIMTCTVSISMHTNNLTSVGWSMCMCTVSKKNNYSVSPLDWLQVATETYHRSRIFHAKNILSWKIWLYLIFMADDPCFIRLYGQMNNLCHLIFVPRASNEKY